MEASGQLQPSSVCNHSAEQLSSESQFINEEEMLDTAEQILSQLASMLIKQNWTVAEVFGQPPEFLQSVEFRGESNVKVIKPENFLGRMYQMGIPEIPEYQFAQLL